MSYRGSQPMGAVLAGGLGRRLGGSKATVRLNGRPMITYPLRAIQEALGSAVVVAKPDSELPDLPGVEVWMEPAEPRHPLTGLVHALGLAQGHPVLICPCDLPLVSVGLVRDLVDAAGEGDALVARSEGRLQPLLGCYSFEAVETLTEALGRGATVTQAVAALGARPYDVAEPELLFNVNTPEDLLQAGALLSAQPNVKS